MLILPQQIEEFISTNLDQPYPIWDEATEYKRNTQVVFKNHIYRTVVNENKGIKPDLNSGKWLLFGVDNSFAGIDLHSHTATVIDDGLDYIEFVFSAVGFDYIGFGAIQGSLLSITEYDSQNVEIQHTEQKIGADRICADSWYDYYYCGIPDQADLGKGKPIDFLYDSLSGTVAKVRVRIHKNSDDNASVGSMVGGNSKDIGQTQFGTKIGVIDYSRKKTDEYGITTIIKRDSRETMQSEVIIPPKLTQIVKREVKANLGTVVMFIAEPDRDSQYEHLIMLGYIQEFEIYINNGAITRARLYTEEVI